MTSYMNRDLLHIVVNEEADCIELRHKEIPIMRLRYNEKLNACFVFLYQPYIISYENGDDDTHTEFKMYDYNTQISHENIFINAVFASNIYTILKKFNPAINNVYPGINHIIDVMAMEYIDRFVKKEE